MKFIFSPYIVFNQPIIRVVLNVSLSPHATVRAPLGQDRVAVSQYHYAHLGHIPQVNRRMSFTCGDRALERIKVHWLDGSWHLPKLAT